MHSSTVAQSAPDLPKHFRFATFCVLYINILRNYFLLLELNIIHRRTEGGRRTSLNLQKIINYTYRFKQIWYILYILPILAVIPGTERDPRFLHSSKNNPGHVLRIVLPLSYDGSYLVWVKQSIFKHCLHLIFVIFKYTYLLT